MNIGAESAHVEQIHYKTVVHKQPGAYVAPLVVGPLLHHQFSGVNAHQKENKPPTKTLRGRPFPRLDPNAWSIGWHHSSCCVVEQQVLGRSDPVLACYTFGDVKPCQHASRAGEEKPW